MAPRRLGIKLLIAVVIAAALAIATHRIWLSWFGQALVRDDGPAKADIAVVLAGDRFGHRIEKAAGLVKDGYVPAVLVSGPRDYDTYECDLAIGMMVRKGYPREWFIAWPNESLSTEDEARGVLADLARRRVRSFILVTSNYHSARAARTFRAVERAMGGGPSFRVVAAPDEHFQPASWWRNREGQKVVFIEGWKAIATALGK